ncbi:MAG: sigma 54-interacting transcriptional regulator [Pseudomonadota bacterium]
MITQQTTMMDEVEDGTAASGVLHVLVMSPDAFLSLPLPAVGSVDVGRSSKCSVRLEDPLASREHARLHVSNKDGVVSLHLEDLGSANGTRVRDTPISPGEFATVLPGEAITIGSTVLMVQQNRPAVGLRRLWSHGYFESRLEDECGRAAATHASFALARVRLAEGIPWTSVVPVLVRTIPLPHLFAAYGPRDYEILFVENAPEQVMKLMDTLVAELARALIGARHGVAWYPRDGRSADALLARANALVKHPTGASRTVGPASAADTDSVAGAGMDHTRELAKRAAGANINVLILGETGVGKDVLARTIHRLSERKGNFVALNCAGLSASLIESELFGHERGSFSGATGAKIGLLETAEGGTVFLDEIGEMPPTLQAKLLRTIETREVLPVGAVKPRAIDVRFIAATNRDLEAEVRRGAFRQDLFFRLNGISLAIPPLRERIDEIRMLVETFIAQSCRDSGRTPTPTLAPDAMDCLLGYGWPGNIRELRNVIERALVLCDEAEIRTEHLPLDKMRTRPGAAFDADESLPAPLLRPDRHILSELDGPSPFRSRADDRDRLPPRGDPQKAAERQRMLDALAAHAWNQTRAAQSLGMPRRTFVSKLEHYRIPRPQKNSGRELP